MVAVDSWTTRGKVIKLPVDLAQGMALCVSLTLLPGTCVPTSSAFDCCPLRHRGVGAERRQCFPSELSSRLLPLLTSDTLRCISHQMNVHGCRLTCVDGGELSTNEVITNAGTRAHGCFAHPSVGTFINRDYHCELVVSSSSFPLRRRSMRLLGRSSLSNTSSSTMFSRSISSRSSYPHEACVYTIPIQSTSYTSTSNLSVARWHSPDDETVGYSKGDAYAELGGNQHCTASAGKDAGAS